MNFLAGAVSDVGRKRSQNQDSFTSRPELGLFVVADGMGGHRGGEIASAMAIEAITKTVEKNLQSSPDWNPREVMVASVLAANRAIFEQGIKQKELQGMGTTTTAILFKNGKAILGQVGDSRCYFLRPNAIWQATRDHSLVQEKLRAGLISREEAKHDRMKNVITRSVGFESEVNVEIFEMDTRAGDIYVLCSDGLSGLVDDPGILALVQPIFQKNSASAQSAGHGHAQGLTQEVAQELIHAANRNGGDDNVTAIVVQVNG